MAYTAKRYISAGSEATELKKMSQGRVSTVIAAIATANGSDPATTQALANANKAKINELIAALKTAGLMATS